MIHPSRSDEGRTVYVGSEHQIIEPTKIDVLFCTQFSMHNAPQNNMHNSLRDE